MGIFAQVWFWSALAFVAGALLSWALLALPARRQLASIDEATLARDSAPRPSRPVVPPLPERPGRYEDDSQDRGLSVFDDEPDDRHSPFDDEPPQVAAQDKDDFDRFSSPLRRMDREHAARTELLSGVDTHDEPEVAEAPERRMPRPSGQSVSGPTVRVPVSGSLDSGGSLFAPPEPPIPSADEARPAGDEAATQYLPAVAPAVPSPPPPEPAREVAAPPEVDKPDDRGWFDEVGDGSGGDDPSGKPGKPGKSVHEDENLVDDLAVDPGSQADSGELVDDVEDIDERPTGTIFTQRTQPVSGDLISRLDDKAEESSSDPEPSEEDAEDEESDAATTSLLPVRKPGATRFDSSSRPSPPKPSPSPSAEPKQTAEATQVMPSAPEATQATQAAQPVEPEGARSLFEPIVPADEAKTTSMPAPVSASASTVRASDGSFVPPGPFGPGSAMPLPGGGAPSPEFTVKASVTALRYCEPDSPLFGRTVAEVWFRTTKDAERVGFRPLS